MGPAGRFLRAGFRIGGRQGVIILGKHHALAVFLGIDSQHRLKRNGNGMFSARKTSSEREPLITHFEFVHRRIVDIEYYLAFLDSLFRNIYSVKSCINQDMGRHAVVTDPFVQ